MWTPAHDKKEICKIIINDPYLKNTMGISAKNVLNQKDLPQDFDSSKIYIMIYDRPSEATGNRIIINSVYQIDVLVASTPPMCEKADKISEQIHNLLNHVPIGNTHEVKPLRNLGVITISQATLYSRGEEFGVYNTIFGKIKS